MKAAPLCDPSTAAALAFDYLDRGLQPVSEYGLAVYAALRPFAPGQEMDARSRAQRIERFARQLAGERLEAIAAALRALPDVGGAVARLGLGDTLSDPDFLELLRFGDGLERIDALLDGAAECEPLRAGGVDGVRAALEPGRSGKLGFYLADAFDPALPRARSSLQAAQAAFDAAAGREIAEVGRKLGRDDLSGDDFVVMREDAESLPAGVRVLRETPTYWLCALQRGDDTLQALRQRDAAANSLADAEQSARERLSASLRNSLTNFNAVAAAIGELDLLVAAARFTIEHDCVAPEIVGSPEIRFEGGRFLPLAEELVRQGRAFVPLDLSLHDPAVLTGPNMGGKSVCLRTCGFIALCAAFGLPVPAKGATVGLFDEIAWLGIGSEDERLGDLLSSFAKEVVRLRDVLARDRQRLLVLVDEFARTTTPSEAKALLVALLERLRERGTCGLAATHLAGVATEAGVRHFAVRGLREMARLPAARDLAAALAALGASMDYSVAEVHADAAGQADALALAGLLGLDERLVERAYRYLEGR